MAEDHSGWGHRIVHLLALASRLEGQGQYNIAKLLRAATDAMARRAAYQLDLPSDTDQLGRELERAVAALAGLSVGEDLVGALKRGAAAMAERRLPLIHETPHPYVCRTCGHAVLGESTSKCPICGAWPVTFQRFPPVYWLDALDAFTALERLRQSPVEVAVLLDGLSEDDMTRIPKDGGWSIFQTVSHLRDAQGVLRARLDLMLTQDNPLLSSQAVFAWATREEAHPPTTQEVFDTYRSSRQETIASLESIPLRSWWRPGQNEEFGPVTIQQQVSYFAAHEWTHLPQIEVIRLQVRGVV